MTTQTGSFGDLQDPVPAMPEGFGYEEDIITEAEEAFLVASLATLELKPFEFHGHVGNRRVTAFGLRYDYARHTVEAADEFPSFLIKLRNKVAAFAGRELHEFQQGWGQSISTGRRNRLAQGQAAIWRDRRRLPLSLSNYATSSFLGHELDSEFPGTDAEVDLYP
jgi:hypothetical protein